MRFLALILFVFSAFTALADEKKYGSFIFNTEISDTLFFIDEIKANDSFELRKALRNHDIQNIVLASPGGNVWEALNMAGIIFDKELRTYIPTGGNCASACSFLFFAGNQRLSDGKLGVHQFLSKAAQQSAQIGKVQGIAQFTVSEIIGFLNEFGTPAFVYERMFEDIEMYYFDPLELMELNSETFGLENSQKIAATKFMMAKINEQKEKKPELTRKEMIALIQTRLKEVGCDPGPADGIWGRRTQTAAVTFAKKAGLPTSKDQLISRSFIEKLTVAPNNYCPKRQYVAGSTKFGKLAGNWKVSTSCSSIKDFYIDQIRKRYKTLTITYEGKYRDALGRSARPFIIQYSDGTISLRTGINPTVVLKPTSLSNYTGKYKNCKVFMKRR